MNVVNLRREYRSRGLDRRDLDADPIAQFENWFGQAAATKSGSWWRKVGIALYKCFQVALGAEPIDPNAMTLATADKEGRPSARSVLLKGVDQRGFIFYTNYESRKGCELAENPRGALVFYWADLERQVCISGDVTKLAREESEEYFKGRPRGSRLAAWASNQSEVVSDRAGLEAKWRQMEARYPGEDVPLPPCWGGYVLAPTRIEFWQGRPNRLHDRFRYTKQADGHWLIERLAP
jgi:pyridoxamine 5'-phosphate oxidase